AGAGRIDPPPEWERASGLSAARSLRPRHLDPEGCGIGAKRINSGPSLSNRMSSPLLTSGSSPGVSSPNRRGGVSALRSLVRREISPDLLEDFRARIGVLVATFRIEALLAEGRRDSDRDLLGRQVAIGRRVTEEEGRCDNPRAPQEDTQPVAH